MEVEASPSVSLGQLTRAAMRDIESRIILNALRANQWNRKRTASALKVSYRSLLYKLKKSGIQNRPGPGPVLVEHSKSGNL
jgi:DNA-binding NtrC family response regulator